MIDIFEDIPDLDKPKYDYSKPKQFFNFDISDSFRILPPLPVKIFYTHIVRRSRIPRTKRS